MMEVKKRNIEIKVKCLIWAVLCLASLPLLSQSEVEEEKSSFKTEMIYDMKQFRVTSLPIIDSKKQNAVQMPPKTALPFFCALEEKMFQATTIPIKFRLGSVDYVNALENK